jgi:hypothetical protein
MERLQVPKWLYVWMKATGVKTRRSLTTTSWGEANGRAAEQLKLLDPANASAAAKIKSDKQMTAARDAVNLWLDRTKHEHGEDGAFQHYRLLGDKLCQMAADEGLLYIQEITPVQSRVLWRPASLEA